MGTRHLTSHCLAAWIDGELELDQLVELLLRHLHERCPVCRREIEVFAGQRASLSGLIDGQNRGRGNGPVLSAEMMRALEREWRRSEALEAEARRQMERLLRQEPSERLKRVRGALLAFRNPHLVRMLVERSRTLVGTDPREACSLARLAEEAAERLPARYGRDLRGSLRLRARAHRANALRVAGDPRGAQEVLEPLLDDIEEVSDPLLRAELLSVGSLLRRDQRRAGEAEGLLLRALELYRQVGAERQVAETRLRLASLCYHLGRAEEAVKILEELAAGSPEAAGPALWRFIRHNLAFYLCELERYDEAEEHLEGVRRAHRESGAALDGLRLLWLEGKVAAGQGAATRAEARLLRARDGFVQAGVGTDAAQVSLDLAMLYVEQGRTAEVQALAEEMMTLFRAQDIHREAIAAFLLFRRASLEETVTREMLRELQLHLERSRGRLPLGSEEPS